MFEAHITFNSQLYGDFLDKIAGPKFGWKYSVIAGDPVLGKDTFCYLSKHDTEPRALYVSMHDVATKLQSVGVAVLRMKIEEVLYDTKTNISNPMFP